MSNMSDKLHYLIQRLTCGDQLYLVPVDDVPPSIIIGVDSSNVVLDSEELGKFLDSNNNYLFGHGGNTVRRLPKETYFFMLID